MIYLTESGSRNIAVAIRPGGSGDVTATHRLWHSGPPARKICIGSPVIYRGHVYQVLPEARPNAWTLQTGRIVWDQRLVGSGTRNASWSSVVLAGDRLYVPNQNADVFVLRASTNFTGLATNSIGGERMNASLAVRTAISSCAPKPALVPSGEVATLRWLPYASENLIRALHR